MKFWSTPKRGLVPMMVQNWFTGRQEQSRGAEKEAKGSQNPLKGMAFKRDLLELNCRSAGRGYRAVIWRFRGATRFGDCSPGTWQKSAVHADCSDNDRTGTWGKRCNFQCD